jgi:PilZ domain
MAERRRADRYNISAPVHVCVSLHGKVEFHIGQIQDISRTGIRFHAPIPIEVGTGIELAFCLPAGNGPTGCVFARASCRAVRNQEVAGEGEKVYGIAVDIDRIEFLKPDAPNG